MVLLSSLSYITMEVGQAHGWKFTLVSEHFLDSDILIR